MVPDAAHVRADYSGASVPVIVAYLDGNAPGSVMDALKTYSIPPVSALHFGNYDWEGLYISASAEGAATGPSLYPGQY